MRRRSEIAARPEYFSPSSLTAAATEIRAELETFLENGSLAPEDSEPDFAKAEEGAIVTRQHKTRERDQSIVAEKKRRFAKEYGRLYCEACAFDFEAIYGKRGADFIECHHTKPLAEMVRGHKTKLSDLVLVCAKCHRMLHRQRPWLSMNELRNLTNRNGVRSE